MTVLKGISALRATASKSVETSDVDADGRVGRISKSIGKDGEERQLVHEPKPGGVDAKGQGEALFPTGVKANSEEGPFIISDLLGGMSLEGRVSACGDTRSGGFQISSSHHFAICLLHIRCAVGGADCLGGD